MVTDYDDGGAYAYVADQRDTGLPSPDHHAVAAHTAHVSLNTRLELGRVLVEYRNREHDTAGAIDAILTALGAQASQPTYTDRLTLHADDLDVPVDGPRWQVLDARDEETWHDLDAVAECEDPGCAVAAGEEEVGCIVLVSTAWSDGFCHILADTPVDARIPAVTA